MIFISDKFSNLKKMIGPKRVVSISVSLFLLFINGLVVLSVYKLGSEKIKGQMKLNLENQAKIFLQQVNLEEYQKLIENPKEFDNSPLYQKVIKNLKNSHEAVKDKDRFVYTLFYKDDKVLFGLDTSNYGDLDGDGVEDHSKLFSEYKEVLSDIKNALKEGQSNPILTELYSDQWGTFISYYMPIIYKGKFLGFLGIDMNASVFSKDINDLKNTLLMTYVVLAILSLVIGGLLYFVLYKFKMGYKTELKLQQAQQELEMVQMSKLAELGELSSIITHEINNPLQAIAASAEMIEIQSVNPKNIDKIPVLANNILNATDKILDIIKSTKNLVRNDSQDLLESVNLVDIIKNAEVLFLDKLCKNNIQYKVSIPENVIIECKPGQIQQVILNTVSNSIFAIKDKDVKWIELKYTASEKYHIFSMIDSGLGLSPDIQEKIKNRFFSTKKNGEGSGLGLSICRKILSKHNGEFYYNPNCVNTCFEFKIPKTISKTLDSNIDKKAS